MDERLRQFWGETDGPVMNCPPDHLKPDAVNHPPHYTFGKIEVLDAIEDWQLSYPLGNVVKYVARAKHKGNELQDLEKALFYLKRHIENLKR